MDGVEQVVSVRSPLDGGVTGNKLWNGAIIVMPSGMLMMHASQQPCLHHWCARGRTWGHMGP